MSHDTTQRPRYACATCPPPDGPHWTPADNGLRICANCNDWLTDTIDEIIDRYHKLNPAPGGTNTGDGTPRPPGFESTPTGSVHIMAMRDRRTSPVARVWLASDGRVHREPARPVLSVAATLDTLAARVTLERGYTHRPPRNLTELGRWLTHQQPWTAQQDWVDLYADLLRRLRAQLRPATGEPRPAWLASCPNTLDYGDYTLDCDGDLFVPSEDSVVIRCHTCSRRWFQEHPTDSWGHLAQLIEDKRLRHTDDLRHTEDVA